MNNRQMHVLMLRETDVQGAVRRLGGDEQLYVTCLERFLTDTTMTELENSVRDRLWDEAFTAAHALKGLAGNMGFVPLMHSVGQLVVLIRGGRTGELYDALEDVKSCYRDITDAIRQFISFANI